MQLASGFHSATDLLEHAALASAAPGEETEGRVQLLTLHRAKGLEFAHVFLPAWNATIFPSQYGDAAEERQDLIEAIGRREEQAQSAIAHAVAVQHRSQRGKRQNEAVAAIVLAHDGKVVGFETAGPINVRRRAAGGGALRHDGGGDHVQIP